jgi:hypothetical protein
MRLKPFFELNGNRYEFMPTQYLIAEYRRLNEENPMSDEDRSNAIKASNLVADAQKFAEKAEECWEKLCEEPTEENQRTYLLFKGMRDNAIADYNNFVTTNNTLQTATKRNIDILEEVAIIALAEQHFNMNINLAKQTWEMFVDKTENHNKIGEWLTAFAECLFGEEEEEEDNSFLSQKRKMDMERENNRKNAFRKKR